jgi:multisubunit Na+/H+ antiporter MnhC subunit
MHMKRISIVITFMVFSLVFLACAHMAQKESTIELKTFNENSS